MEGGEALQGESKVHGAPENQERRPTGIRPEPEPGTKTPTHSLNRTLCCGHIPRYLRTPSMSVRMSYPLMRAVPDVGGKSPVRMDLGGRNEQEKRSISC